MPAEHVEVGDRIHAAGPAAEVALGLLAPQQQLAEDRQLLLLDAQPLVGQVAIAGNLAAAEDLGHGPGLPQ